MKKIILLTILLLMPLSFAADFTYKIDYNEALVKIQLDDLEFESLEIPNNIDFIDFIENGKSVIEFKTKDYLEKSGSEYFFISTNELHRNSSIKVVLPEGAILTEKIIIFPKNYEISTDGYRIILEWNNSNEKDILINYKTTEKNYLWVYILIIVLIIFSYIYLKLFYNRKDYSRNLFREEKEIIKYLEKKRECWTKELIRDLNISKVKLSRKIRSLEEKGLVKKTPIGNENRIKLIKK